MFYYTPDHLAYQEGRLTATGWPLCVQRVVGNHAILGPKTEVDLADFDVVWLRQDPPGIARPPSFPRREYPEEQAATAATN